MIEKQKNHLAVVCWICAIVFLLIALVDTDYLFTKNGQSVIAFLISSSLENHAIFWSSKTITFLALLTNAFFVFCAWLLYHIGRDWQKG